MRKNISILLFFTCMSFVEVSRGSSDASTKRYLFKSHGLFHLGYGEHIPGKSDYLDTENGNILVSQIELSLQDRRWGIDNLYRRYEFTLGYGHTRYDGSVMHIPTGETRPYHTESGNGIVAGQADLGKAWHLAPDWFVTPYVTLGFRYWWRNLNNGHAPGYLETYRHGFAGLGVKTDWSPARKWTLSLNGSVRHQFLSAMGASIDPERFQLGNRPGYRLDGRVSYALSEQWKLFAQTGWAGFQYGRSSVHESNFYEPGSSTNQISYLIGLGYRL